MARTTPPSPPLLAILAVALVVPWLTSCTGRPDTPTTPTEPAAPAEPTTPTAPVSDPTVVWPSPGAATRFESPDAAARDFATTFLGFASPVVEAFQQGDSRSGEVPVRPAESGPVTTILVRQVGSGEDWSVLGAVTEDIDVTTPKAGETIASPVQVAGLARAFEGVVNVEVREAGKPTALGSGVVTGGGDAMKPFSGTIAFEAAGATNGALVFYTRSARDGSVWSATAFPVALGPASGE